MIIEVPSDRIDDFRRTWPASGLYDLDRLIITTDRDGHGGEVVDLEPYADDGQRIVIESIDGPALAALVSDEVNGYRVRHNGATKTEQWIEFLGYSIEISIDPADEAEGWIEFDIWNDEPGGSCDFIASDVVQAEDWRRNGPAALRAWAIAARIGTLHE